MSILFNIKNIAENKVGLRFVTVEGYAKAYKFYTDNNFTNLKKNDDKIKEIRYHNRTRFRTNILFVSRFKSSRMIPF